MIIRPYESPDWPAVWPIIEPVFRAGETYAVPRDITETEARAAWIDAPLATFVADDGGRLVGTYYLKANQRGPGDHVANCGYIVAAHARGRGIAAALCEHSQREALHRGFQAMVFNCVVSSNVSAVRLWQRLGFSIAGTLPGCFRHPTLGFVDAYVMYKRLAP